MARLCRCKHQNLTILAGPLSGGSIRSLGIVLLAWPCGPFRLKKDSVSVGLQWMDEGGVEGELLDNSSVVGEPNQQGLMLAFA